MFTLPVASYVSATSPSSFSPTDLSGCRLWIDFSDASSLTVSGGKIYQANDKSGNGFYASQTNASYLPIYATSAENGLSVASFNLSTGNAMQMIFSGNPLASASAATAFFVSRNINSDSYDKGNNCPMNFFGADGHNCHHPWTDMNMYNDFGTTFRRQWSTFSDLSVLASFTMKSGTGYWEAFQNTTSMYTDTDTSFVGPTNTPQICGNYAYEGYVCEIIIYDHVTTSTEDDEVRTYLNAKWGI